MDITIEQLLALDAIARTGSFAGAAAELYKVPSAVSYNIQGLEDALGVPIFNRRRRKSVLTSNGRRLLEASRAVLEQARNLERIASVMRDGWESELHVVVDGAMPMAAITRSVRRFSDPEIPTRLRVDVAYQDGVMERFDNAPADIALMLGFDSEEEAEGYERHALPDLDLLLVASPEHPLAGQVVTSQLRADHAELVVRDSSSRFSLEPKESFMGSRNVVYLSDFYSKRVALLDAAGYGWIPQHFIEEDLARERLQLLDAPANSWTYSPQILTHRGRSLGRGGQLFLETLMSDADEAP